MLSNLSELILYNLHNTSFKRIVSNFSFRIFGNIISRSLVVITIPIIARAFGPATYGNWNLILVIISYALLPVDYGFSTHGLREIACEKDKIKREEIVSTILSARLTISIITFVIATILIILFFRNNIGLMLSMSIGTLFIISQALNIDFFFIAIKNLFIPTLSQILGQLTYVACVFIFIKKPEDLLLLVVFYLSYYFIIAFIMIILYGRDYKLHITFSIVKYVQLLKKTFKIGSSAKIEMLASSFPLLVISYFHGSYQLGIFSAAKGFYTAIILIFQSLLLVLAPYLVNLKNLDIDVLKERLYFLGFFMLLSGIVIAGLFYLLGESVIYLLFGKSFGASRNILNLFLLLAVPISPLGMLFNSVLVYVGDDKNYLRTTLITSLVILIFTPILVYSYSLTGAVVAMSLSGFIYAIFSLIYVGRFFSKKIHNESLA